MLIHGNIFCSISQREIILMKNIRNKSCRYSKVTQILSLGVFSKINQLITICKNWVFYILPKLKN